MKKLLLFLLLVACTPEERCRQFCETLLPRSSRVVPIVDPQGVCMCAVEP